MSNTNEARYIAAAKAHMESGDNLFDFVMPNGKRLGDCTSEECREAADWLKKRGELKMSRWLTLVAGEVKKKIRADAKAYRLQQAEKLLELFKEANGREATSSDELGKWAASPEGQAAMAYDLDKRGKIIP